MVTSRANDKPSIFQVDKVGETNYYDSVTGKLLYTAPRGRTFEEFKAESKSHGWPSFRDSEVEQLPNLTNLFCICVPFQQSYLR